jgi:(p)ppGpp synthase/HD superfamily hydrolase
MTPAEALVLARELHGDQVDRLGEDYVDGHLSRVQEAVAVYHDPVLAEAAALHDTLEDTGATPELLLEDGVSPEAIEVVEEVTKRPDEHGDEGYKRFAGRIGQSGNLRSVRLKLADLEDHLRPVPPEQIDKIAPLLPRYRDAYSVLLARQSALAG